jgi:hypothetical protein
MMVAIMVDVPEEAELLGVALVMRQKIDGQLRDVLNVDALEGAKLDPKDVLERIKSLAALFALAKESAGEKVH